MSSGLTRRWLREAPGFLGERSGEDFPAGYVVIPLLSGRFAAQVREVGWHQPEKPT
jgi:hypothetical protein